MCHFGGDTDHGEVYACGGQGIYEKSLYLILNLSMKLKLLLKNKVLIKWNTWASLVAHWWRIGFNAGDTGSISGLERSHCCVATKPLYYNYWTCVLETGSHNYWSPYALEPMLCNKRSHCNEKSVLPQKSSPHLPQLEKILHSKEDLAEPKISK